MIFTFGFGHVCSCGLSLRECYVEIEGDYDTAREVMLERYGRKWAFQYDTLTAARGYDHPVELHRVVPSEVCECGGLGREPFVPSGGNIVPPEVAARMSPEQVDQINRLAGPPEHEVRDVTISLPAERLVEIERLADSFVDGHLASIVLNNIATGVGEVTQRELGKPLAVMIVGTAADGFMVASTLGEADFARELRALLERVEAELEIVGPVGGKPHTA